MIPDKLHVAQRFAELPCDKRRAFLEALHKQGIAFQRLPIPAAGDGARVVPLSYAQQRLWFLYRFDPAAATYHMPGAFRLRGRLDQSALARSLAKVAERHAILRTTYRDGDDGVPEQVIHQRLPITIAGRQLTGLSTGERQARARKLAGDSIRQPFDLEAAAPWRVLLITLADQDHLLVVTLHHIAADGASIPLLMQELEHCYQAYRRGEQPALAALPVQYADYAAWQRNWLEAGEKERQLAYWRDRLGPASCVLDLPTDRARPATPSHRGAEHGFVLPAALAEQLRRLAQRRRCTLFVVLAAAFKLLLHRYSGQSDVRIGVPVANRQRLETERLLGCFVNTVVLRTRMTAGQTFAGLLADVQQAATAAQDHQDLPFEALIEALAPERRLNQSPLVQVMFDHGTSAVDGLDRFGDLRVEPFALPVRTAKFDISLSTAQTAAGAIVGRIAYATDLFDAATIARLQAHFEAILTRVAADPDTRLSEVGLLSEPERRQLDAWSRGRPVPADQLAPVHRLIERHAGATSEAVAILFDGRPLTYATVNRRANRLAHRLIALGIGAGCRVGILMERAPDLIVSLLAVLKSGAAYVPLDPAYPAERLRAVREDAALRLVISRSTVDSARALQEQCPVLMHDREDLDALPDSNPEVAVDLADLAYIIYTSGSTGRPKGVAVEHGPLADHCLATGAVYDITAQSRELHFLSFAFDGAHERWLVPFCFGASIVLRDDSLWTAEKTYDVIGAQAVTHAGFPPKYIQQLADWATHQGRPPSVWLYSFGGEAMPKAGLERVQQALRPRHVINGYGPTEAVISPVVWKGDAASRIGSPYVPIGRPVGDRRAYVLDANLMPVPQGLPGELCLGGAGLARGYHGRPGPTADRFVPDPFGRPGARLYRTGDTVRWLADGTLEFIGRSDHQVKVRGFRIELGEVEAHLMDQPDVRRAVVVAHDPDGHCRLVGYVVPPAGTAIDTADLAARLGRALPDHMVPAQLIVLDAVPVTATGKLDRQALPEPVWQAAQSYVAPSTPVETTLAQIWQETLGIDRVGVTDNFFELGGDSILSLQIVARARRRGLRLTPRQLFERQTIAALAGVAVVSKASDGGEASAEVSDAVPEGPLPLTPIQQAFFAEAIPGRDRWNQSVLLRGGDTVDAAKLDTALRHLLDHHDALRLRFGQDDDGHWQQSYADALPDDLLWQHHIDDGAMDNDTVADRIAALCDQAQGSLDLAAGPLFRALLIHLPDGGQRLFLVGHHLVVDGVSWRILLEDLQGLYRQLCQGVSPSLPAKTASYGHWARRLHDHARTLEVAAEADHWRDSIAGIADLPCDMPDGDNRQRLARTCSIRLDPERTRQLLQDAPAAYRTQVNDLLLAALARAVRRWSGRSELSLMLEGHGREDIVDDADVSRTVGWFTAVFPVRLPAPEDDASEGGWGNAIRQVKETLRAVPGKGIGYGLLRYLGEPALRDTLAAGPVGLAFNYLGQFESGGGLWRPADEPCGDGTDPDAPLGGRLTINGQVADGALSLHCRYSRGLYRPATVEALMAAYRQALDELIDHCLAQRPGQVSPSDFPQAALSQRELDALPSPAPTIEDIYPLSPMQRGMVMHGRRHPASDAYMVQVQAAIAGLDVARLKAAWQAAVDRHAILRTGFVVPDGRAEPVQVVHKTATIPTRTLDWRGKADVDGAWRALCEGEYRRHFALDRAPLIRIVLARVADTGYRFVVTWHHALLDGWSMSRLLGDVLRVYDKEPVAAATGRFGDYIAWSRRQATPASVDFWRRRLAPLTTPTRLSDALPAGRDGAGQGVAERTLDAAAVRRLSDFAGAEKVTLNTLVQAAWVLLLRQRTGQPTVAFGATVSGRSADLPDIERIMGLLIATLPVVQTPRLDDGVGAWLRVVQADNLALREFEHAPPPAVQCWSGTGGDGEEAAPFDTVLIFENYPVDDALRRTVRGQVSFSDVGNRGQTSYPLTAVIVPRDTLTLRLEYARAVFDDAAMQALVADFERLLLRLASNGQATLGQLLAHDPAPVS